MNVFSRSLPLVCVAPQPPSSVLPTGLLLPGPVTEPSLNIAAEVARRRTFAIVSHPDAGKTTLTEKLLLFSGAIQLAGAVRSKKAARSTTSDWMAMEQERGISVTTSVMSFEYPHPDHLDHPPCQVNLLDTPGHADFGEDTYRVLTAVDAALMVIDGAKGVESRTEKLIEICRLRDTPVVTFVNKFDRECMEPLELLDNIEQKLGPAAPPSASRRSSPLQVWARQS